MSRGGDPINVYIQMFRNALNVDKKMCLCGLLGAEFDGLPDKVRTATHSFFEKNIQWLTEAFHVKGGKTDEQSKNAAISLIS